MSVTHIIFKPSVSVYESGYRGLKLQIQNVIMAAPDLSPSRNL